MWIVPPGLWLLMLVRRLRSRASLVKDQGVDQKLDERLEAKELEALESAFKSGFISEESYKRGRQRIEEKLNKLK